MATDSIIIQPGPRRGRVQVPFSKSHLHRLLIADFLAGATGAFGQSAASADVQATQRCLEALGGTEPAPVLNCGESGSTLRFLLPVAMALKNDAVFTAEGRLPERPVAPFLAVLRQHGVSATEEFPLRLSGRLLPGRYSLQGNISSQIVTGLLFALPLLGGGSAIQLTTPLESRGYVDMTLGVLQTYGICVTAKPHGYRVQGGQRYSRPGDIVPERDWSGAAFWLAMNELGSQIDITGLNETSVQPDRCVRKMLKGMGGMLDVSQCPDCFPALAIVAGAYSGTTVFTGVRRLRLKESDRLSAMADVLERFGAHADADENAFTVHGIGPHFCGNVEIRTFGDHRIAMAAGVGATIADGPVAIENSRCVEKSYHDFWEQLA